MSTDYQSMREMRAFAEKHLSELAAELVEWQDTSILRNGLMRELADLCAFDPGNHLRQAERMVERAAIRRVAAEISKANEAPVAYRYKAVDATGNPLPGWRYCDDAGTLALRQPLYANPPLTVNVAMVERGLKAAAEASDARLARYSTVRNILVAALTEDTSCSTT